MDLSNLRAKGKQVGEVDMEIDSGNNEPAVVINENLVNQLVEMGYPYHACRRALYHTSQQLEVLYRLMNMTHDRSSYFRWH